MIRGCSQALTGGTAASLARRSLGGACVLPGVLSLPNPQAWLLTARARLFSSTAPVARQAASSASRAALVKTVFVKTEGAPDWVKIQLSPSAMDVADLKEEAAKKLQLTERLDKLTLHFAVDTAGSQLGDALDSTDSLEEALVRAPIEGKIRLVIKAAAPAVPAAPAGE